MATGLEGYAMPSVVARPPLALISSGPVWSDRRNLRRIYTVL